MFKKIPWLLSVLFIVWGCSESPESKLPKHIQKIDKLEVYKADSQPAYDIQFERTASYGSRENVYVTVGGSDKGLLRVDNKGRVFIPDRRQNTIRIFSPEGNYIGRMGRQGKGPGEFGLIGMIRIGSNHFYTYDYNLHRINVFSLDSLAFSHTVNMDPREWRDTNARTSGPSGKFFLTEEEMLLVEFNSFSLPDDHNEWKNAAVLDSARYRYYEMNHEGEIISEMIFKQKPRQRTHATFRGNPFVSQLPVHGQPLMTVSRDGRIFSAWSEDFLIKIFDSSGQYIRAFYHPYKGPPLDREELIESSNKGRPSRSFAKTAVLPDRWPALHSIMIDDQNRLWIATIVDDKEVYQWWVVDEYGKLLARFDWQRRQPIGEIKKNAIYVKEKNEIGENIIVRYNFEMN